MNYSTVLDDLYDKATGLFDKFVDFKFEDLEYDRARDQKLWEFDLFNRQYSVAYDPALPNGGGGNGGGPNYVMIGGVLLLVAGGFYLLNKG